MARPMTHKAILLALIPCALSCAGPLWAQTESAASDGGRNAAARDEPEEVIVRGRRLADFRSELQVARIRVYNLFNDLNSDDAFDVHCQVEDSTGTRLRRQTCRPQFKDDIAHAAAKAWVSGIKDGCPSSSLDQACIFGGAANLAKSRAMAEESWEPGMQQQFAIELARVVAENPEMQQAILDYEAVERAYSEARQGGRPRPCDRPEPPPRCSR